MAELETLLNEYEAGKLVGLSTKTLQMRRYRHLPPKYLKIGRSIRYRASDLEAWLQKTEIDPEKPLS